MRMLSYRDGDHVIAWPLLNLPMTLPTRGRFLSLPESPFGGDVASLTLASSFFGHLEKGLSRFFGPIDRPERDWETI